MTDINTPHLEREDGHHTGEDDGDHEPVPPCPGGLFNFPPGSVVVIDADEEVMELYMSLSSLAPHPGGLGYLDPSAPSLDIRLDLRPRAPSAPLDLPTSFSSSSIIMPASKSSSGTPMPTLVSQPTFRSGIKPISDPAAIGLTSRSSSGVGRSRKKKEKEKVAVDEIVFTVYQDPSALRSRKGDTGSVLWRSTYHLSKHILSQTYHPTSSQPPLLSSSIIPRTSVLELGAGIGLLGLAIGRLWKKWVASDQSGNIKLILRNFRENGLGDGSGRSGREKGGGAKKAGDTEVEETVVVEELDWLDVSARHRKNGIWLQSKQNSEWDSISFNRDGANKVDVRKHRQHHTIETNGDEEKDVRKEADGDMSEREQGGYDLVVAVDCIYNEHLVGPLVDTIAALSESGQGLGLVWVVVELRSSDVVRLFLDTWLNHESGPWTIIRLGPGAMGDWDGTEPRWVGWVGWRAR